MSLILIKLFTVISSLFYSCAMLSYAGKLLGFRSQNCKIIAYIIFATVAGIYTYKTIFQVPVPVIYSCAFIILLILFHCSLNGMWIQHVFASGNFIFHLLAARGIILSLFSLWFKKDLNWVIQNEHLHILTIGLSFTFSLYYLLFFSSKLFPIKDILTVIHRIEYITILAISQGVLNVILIVASIIYYFKDMPLWFSLYHLTVYILIFISFHPLFNFCIKSSNLQKYKSAYKLYEEQIKKQVEAYVTQVSYIQRMRKFRHDWVHMKEVLFPLISLGNKEATLQFLNEIDSTMNELSYSYKEFSSNPLIQAILLHCNALCQQLNIRFEASVIFPNELPLSDFDLCRIFTNITNNALEANERLIDQNGKYIKITTSLCECWCTITCINSFDGHFKQLNGEYHSLKDDSFAHGFGIKNMEAILESCGGFIMIEPNIECQYFLIRIHIPIEKAVL